MRGIVHARRGAFAAFADRWALVVCVGAALSACSVETRAMPADSDVSVETTVDATAEDLAPSGDGERCETALAIGPGVFDAQALQGYAADYGAGPDRVYAVTLGAGERLKVELPRGPVVYLVTGAPARCTGLPATATGHTPAYWQPDSGVMVNVTGRPEVVFVVVRWEGYATNVGAFRMKVAVDTPGPGDVCSTADELRPGADPATLTGQTFDGLAADYMDGDGTCDATGEPDRVYRISVPPLRRVTVSALRESGPLHLSLIAGPADACEAATLACDATARTDMDAAATLTWANAYADRTQDVFAVVSAAADAHAHFGIRAALEPFAPGDACGNAEIVTPGHYPGQATLGFGEEVASFLDCDPPSELFPDLPYVDPSDWAGRVGDRVYRIDVPAGKRLDVTLRAETPMTPEPRVRLVAGDVGPGSQDGGSAYCFGGYQQATCLAGARAAGAEPATTSWSNRGAESTWVFVIVLGFDSKSAGTFALDLAWGDPAGHGDTCANAEVLAPGSYPDETTVGLGADFPPDTAAEWPVCNLYGPDHVYAITVPARMTLKVTATPSDSSAYLAAIAVPGDVAACERRSRTCIASRDGPHAVRHLNWVNRGEAQTVYVAVAASTPGGGGTRYRLDVEVTPWRDGELCDNAIPLPADRWVTGSTRGFANDYERPRACGFPGAMAATAVDRAYVLTVPPRSAAELAIHFSDPQGKASIFELLRFDLVAGDASACDQAQCTQGGHVGPNETASTTLINNTDVPKQLHLILDAYPYFAPYGDPEIDFGLEMHVVPWSSPPGDTCAEAIPITTPHFSSGLLDARAYASDVAFEDCGTVVGSDMALRVVVPPATRLEVALHAWWFATVALIRGPAEACAAPGAACVAHALAWPAEVQLHRPPFDVRRVQWTNTGAQPEEIFIVVGARGTGAPGVYAVVTDLVPLAP